MNNIEPSENPEFYKWGVFYYNPDDDRILVPKKVKTMGWTFNFAKPEVYHFLFIVGIIMWLSNKFG
jgi:uncharacterized membrane protein